MHIPEERIREIVEIKERLAEKILKHEEEIEILKKNVDILEQLVRESSFTKASQLHTDIIQDSTVPKAQSESEVIPIMVGSQGEVIANAYVTPEQISIILNDGMILDDETPPLRSFFIKRIIGNMVQRDEEMVREGLIQDDSVIDAVIEKNGSGVKKIVIKNYRLRERVKEIINAASWSLARMLDCPTR